MSNGRDLNIDAVDEIAQGRVWIGTDALELGLVDELGSLDDAIASAAEIAELENYDTFYVTRDLSPQELFWKEFFGQAFAVVGKWQFAQSNSALIGEVKRVIKEFDSFAQLNDPMGTYVLCLPCNIN